MQTPPPAPAPLPSYGEKWVARRRLWLASAEGQKVARREAWKRYRRTLSDGAFNALAALSKR